MQLAGKRFGMMDGVLLPIFLLFRSSWLVMCPVLGRFRHFMSSFGSSTLVFLLFLPQQILHMHDERRESNSGNPPIRLTAAALIEL
jgi:hypothetical protein